MNKVDEIINRNIELMQKLMRELNQIEKEKQLAYVRASK